MLPVRFVCYIRRRRPTISSDIIVVKDILDPSDVIYIAHTMVSFALWPVVFYNVL